MHYETTVNRYSAFSVNDLVTLNTIKASGLYNETEAKVFFVHEPVKVIDVDAITDKKPYTFRYFLENCRGERMFLTECLLLLFSKRSSNNLVIPELTAIDSKFELDDTVYCNSYERRNGKVVDVRVNEENRVPFFTYLVEYPDKTRKLYNESVLTI